MTQVILEARGKRWCNALTALRALSLRRAFQRAFESLRVVYHSRHLLVIAQPRSNARCYACSKKCTPKAAVLDLRRSATLKAP